MRMDVYTVINESKDSKTLDIEELNRLFSLANEQILFNIVAKEDINDKDEKSDVYDFATIILKNRDNFWTAKKKDERTMSLTYRDLGDGGDKYTFKIINGVYVPKPLSANPKTRMFSTDEKKTIKKIEELIGDKDRITDKQLIGKGIKLSRTAIRELGFNYVGHYISRKD